MKSQIAGSAEEARPPVHPTPTRIKLKPDVETPGGAWKDPSQILPAQHDVAPAEDLFNGAHDSRPSARRRLQQKNDRRAPPPNSAPLRRNRSMAAGTIETSPLFGGSRKATCSHLRQPGGSAKDRRSRRRNRGYRMRPDGQPPHRGPTISCARGRSPEPQGRGGSIMEAADDILKILFPTLRGKAAKQAGLILRHRLGELARRSDQAEAALRDVRKYFNSRPIAGVPRSSTT